MFAVKSCEWHLDAYFTKVELKEQSDFDSRTLDSALHFEHGINNVTDPTEHFSVLLDRWENF